MTKSFCVLWCYCTILVLASISSTHGSMENFKNDLKMKVMSAAAECIPKVGANEDDIIEILGHETPSRREGKCLISCVQIYLGLQEESGKPNTQGTMKILEALHDEDPEMYTNMIKISLVCGPELNALLLTDPCEMAIEIQQCAMREAKKLGINGPFEMD